MINKFYEDVEKLGFRFPGKVISEKTGFPKGTVSEYLNKKKKPSEAFIKKFYEEFKISSTNVPRETSHTTLTPEDYAKKYIASMEDQVAFLKRIVEVNLIDFARSQQFLHADLKAAIKRAAERAAKGNQVELKTELDRISIYAAEYLDLSEKVGSHVPEGKKRVP